MRADRGCAVIAAAFPPDMSAAASVLEPMGFSEIIAVQDGLKALKCVRDCRPDALIADAVLPLMDGVSLAKRIDAMPLTVYPAMVVLTPRGMSAPGVPESCAVLEKPVQPEMLKRVLEMHAPERRPVPEFRAKRVRTLLDSLGVPEHPGKDYLQRAILIAWQDARFLNALTARLYPAVAGAFGVNCRQAERAMRHAIDVAWRSGEIEAQYKIFGDTIDAGRGNPTCGEMIAQIADILRWEGKA